MCCRRLGLRTGRLTITVNVVSDLLTKYRTVTQGSSLHYFDVTPSDNLELPTNVVLIGVNGDGTSGDIAIEQADGSTFVFKGVEAGGSFCSNAVKVLSTGTTATSLFVGVNK